MATSDLTDLAPIDVQFLIWGYALTCCIPARQALTRFNEATISERTPTVDLSERYWDRTARDLRTITINGEPPPPSIALAGVRLAPTDRVPAPPRDIEAPGHPGRTDAGASS